MIELKGLLAQLRNYKKESILAPLFKMLEALLDLFVPLVMADIIDVGINTGGEPDRRYIILRCGMLVLLAAVGLACSVCAQYFAAKAAVGSAAGLRHSLLGRIQSLSFSQMDRLGASTLITRMTSDVNQMQNGLNLFLRLFLRSPFIVVGAMIMAFGINARAAWIFVAAIPLLSVVVFGIMLLTTPRYRRVQGKLDAVMSAVREDLTGVRVVRAFGKEREETESFEGANEALTTEQLRVGRLSALMNPATYLIVNLAIIAILSTGSSQVDAGRLLTGDVIALISYMSQILVELVKLANLIIQATKALACAQRVQAVLDTEPDMSFPAAEREGAHTTGEPAVRFDHVSLRYCGAGGDSLTDVSFTAERGQTIGVIGGTGSGKTSLVSLISRYYDATGGEVSVFGRPVAEWPRGALRSCVGDVMQRAQLFSGTIRSNLTFGAAEASDEMLWQALETAQAADFVRQKPLGLDEPVEQGGRNLSGGQRQRLTIARALSCRPEILILDDSASALDYATDAALRRALARLPGETTVFIVSQRTSSLRHADKILVLDDGRLVGSGTHEELLEGCESYREIYDSQFGKAGER